MHVSIVHWESKLYKCKFCELWQQIVKKKILGCPWRKEVITSWQIKQRYKKNYKISDFILKIWELKLSRIFEDLECEHRVIKVFQGWPSKILKIRVEDKGNIFKGNLDQFKVYNSWKFKDCFKISLENPQISRQGRG